MIIMQPLIKTRQEEGKKGNGTRSENRDWPKSPNRTTCFFFKMDRDGAQSKYIGRVSLGQFQFETSERDFGECCTRLRRSKFSPLK